ncbi:MAG: hypothetical protein M3460_31080 [Actinomycetota bacterium]|nr:hypothetical protein [Actinomycetota bacterium]
MPTLVSAKLDLAHALQVLSVTESVATKTQRTCGPSLATFAELAPAAPPITPRPVVQPHVPQR